MANSNLFTNDSFFTPLTQNEKEILLSNSTLISFGDNETIVLKNSILYSVFYVKKGWVKLKTEYGKLFNIIGKGDFMGLRYLFSGAPVIFSAYGMREAQVIQMDKRAFKKVFFSNHQFVKNVYNKSTENIDTQLVNLFKYKDHKINGALAAFLLQYKDREVVNYLTHKEISEVIGYSRESVCRAINDFKKLGHIKKDSKKDILKLDIESLKAIQKFG